MKHYLVFIIVLFLPLFAHAEATWTGSIGAGQMIVLDGIKQSNMEKQIMSIQGVTKSESIRDKTTYKSLGIGRCWNENFCVEVAYLWGARFNTNLVIKNIGVGVVDIGGSPVDFGTLPTNITILREGDISATQLSALWKIPASDYIDVFGRVGLYEYNVKTTAKILLPCTSIFLAKESNERGIAPMASIGLDANFLKKATIRVEGQKTGVASIFSVLLVYRIK